MATSKENDLIGYDPLAWMENEIDKDQESIEEECLDSGDSLEQLSCADNEVSSITAIDDSVASADVEDIEALNVTEDDTNEPVFDLEAKLNIQNVVKLHENLKSFLATHDQIEINASDVSSIDTATLQLLVSLKKEAVKLQKKVTIIYPSPRFVESTKLLGLLDVLGVHDV